MALNVHASIPPQSNTNRGHYNYKERKQQINPVAASQQGSVNQAQVTNNSTSAMTSDTRTGHTSVNRASSENMSSHNSSNGYQHHSKSSSNSHSYNQRQQGVIEKMLHSYGFLDSEVQKDNHLFFHYSEVVGDVNSLQVGDLMEFNMSYDYRSSRWLAVSVTKVETALTVSKDLFSGEIFIKAEPQEKFKSCLDRNGRISYEQSGETFFIPYSTLDLEDDIQPHQIPQAVDPVAFYIATDKKTGHMWATCVKKLEPPPMSQGVVCSLKENFGFIERADVVKEIFFHYSEYAGNIAELVLGDDVEFSIQSRNNKEVATSISKLPEGTVVFEDVSTEKKRGKIAKVIKATRKHAEPLAGSINYETADDRKEIAYSERDISGEFTLFVGDVVEFQIAKDRRDGLIHATNITLCEESFIVSKEKRDKGVVSSVKESYGFLQILSADCGTGVGDAQLFFHFNELYESTNTPVVVGDEIEFTIAYDPGNKSKPIAIRIKKLAKGSIRQDQVISAQTFTGSVVQDQPSKPKKSSPNSSGGSTDHGIIKYQVNSKESATIIYLVKDADLRYGDKVSFNVCESKRSADSTTSKRAVNIKLLSRLGIQTGFVCTLKDSFGFIETLSIDDEIFFHYSCYNGDAMELNIGDLVEYSLACRSKKVSAENVRRAVKDKLTMDVGSSILTGQVTRVISSTDNKFSSSEKDSNYCGLITTDSTKPGSSGVIYPFAWVALCNRRLCPPVGTQVEFQVGKISGAIDRAVNVINVKDLVTGRVDSIKGTFGFLDIEDREKKVYFSMSDIQDGSSLTVGDNVQCVIVSAYGSNRVSGVCVRKISGTAMSSSPPSARPDRLISKLKTQMSITEGPKLVLIRKPLGPDGKTKGFAPRVNRQIAEKDLTVV